MSGGSSGSGSGSGGCDIFIPLLTSPAYETIMTLNRYFVNGDFASLDANLTLASFRNLSKQLYMLKDTSSQMYESVRALLTSILQNIYQGMLQHRTLVTTKADLLKQTEKADNLNSAESILAYLKKLQQQTIVFTSAIQTVAARLKPEYAMYLSMYGIPMNGIFEPDKLADILMILSLQPM